MCRASKRVYVDLVGDLFHSGHVELLRRAAEFGSHLTVGVLSDQIVSSYKRQPVMTHKERLSVVSACRYVDDVIENAPYAITRPFLDHHEIDIVIHGDDISTEAIEECYKAPAELGILELVSYSPGISTTELIERIQVRFPAE